MNGTKLHVLLAEDYPNDIAAFRNALANRQDDDNFELNVVQDGLAALDYLRRPGEYARIDGQPLIAKRPDLVVLNINMPEMNGWEVLRHMKGDLALRRIPVVIWTISERQEDSDLSFDLGAQGYFVKPVDATDMNAQVNAILTCFRWAYLNPCARL
jgi:CheY-like chemotaxis protein